MNGNGDCLTSSSSIQGALDRIAEARQGLNGLAMRIDSFISLNLQSAEIYQDKFKFAAAFIKHFAIDLSIAEEMLNAALAEKGGSR